MKAYNELINNADTAFRRISSLATVLQTIDPADYPFEFADLLSLIQDIANSQSEALSDYMLSDYVKQHRTA